MHIIAVGLNHKTAPVELRERVAIGDDELAGLASSLAAGGVFAESAVLCTCNRSEVYGCVPDVDAAVKRAIGLLAKRATWPEDHLSSLLYTYVHAEASRHLFRVACGIDSMVLGESQVLGQVREAFEKAGALGSASTVLATLARNALEVGKQARTETNIGVGRLSVSSAAVDLARSVLGDLSGDRVMVVGAGEMSELTLTHLVDAGVRSIRVANRTHERARALAERFGGEAIAFDQFPGRLAESDIVITQTGAREPLIGPAAVREALRLRRSRPLVFIDIAVPRDVDPAVGDLANVFLFDIDDLEAISAHHMAERQAEVVRVEALISNQLARFNRWLKGLQAVPLIQQLEAEFERVRQDELERALRRIRGLSPEQAAGIDQALHRYKQKLVRPPIEALKRLVEGDADEEVLAIFREVYGLSAPQPDRDRPDEGGSA